MVLFINPYPIHVCVFASYDEGTIMIKVGREEPAISMDVNGGKIIWAKHSEMQQVNLKALPEGKHYIDVFVNKLSVSYCVSVYCSLIAKFV